MEKKRRLSLSSEQGLIISLCPVKGRAGGLRNAAVIVSWVGLAVAPFHREKGVLRIESRLTVMMTLGGARALRRGTGADAVDPVHAVRV